MTTNDFKNSINQELEAASIPNMVLKVDEDKNYHTCLHFSIKIHPDLTQWLNKRFVKGVKILDFSAIINHSKESK